MGISTEHPFTKHTENLREVKKSLVQIERAHKTAIRGGQSSAIESLARVHMFLVGVLAETTLWHIITDPGGFNNRERELIKRAGSQISRWHAAVEYAFRRHYAVPIHEAVSTGIPTSSRPQLDTCQRLLDEELRPLIEDRNKLAHGQWRWRLNAKETAFLTAAAPPVLNYRAIWARGHVISGIGDLIGTLVVSAPTFQRDYAQAIRRIDSYRPHLGGSDYNAWVTEIRKKKR